MAPDRSPGHGKLDSCVICLEPVSERAIVVPCNHYSFDFLCLLGWLEHAPSCPLCNAPSTSLCSKVGVQIARRHANESAQASGR